LSLENGFCVYAHHIFCTTGADEGTTAFITENKLVYLLLESRRTDQPPLRVLGLEYVSVWNNNFDETIGEIGVE
jgi:hypothetical protein